MHKQIRFIAQNIEHTTLCVEQAESGPREHVASMFHKARMKGEG